MAQPQRTSLLASFGWRLAPVGGLLLLMWLVTGANLLLLGGSWLRFGVRPHDPGGLWPNLVYAPLLHVGLAHLLANSLPFAILGAVIGLQSAWRFALVTAVGVVASGAAAWLLGASGSVHIGASGLVFTYFGWLIVR